MSCYLRSPSQTLHLLVQLHQDVVATLEAKRKVKSEVFHKKTTTLSKLRQKVIKDGKVAKRIAPYQKVIEAYGYA